MTDVEHNSGRATDLSVSCFPVPEESELPENLQGLFRKAREAVGFVPNDFRAYSFRPERLGVWFGHYRQLHEPTETLDAAEREMIAAGRLDGERLPLLPGGPRRRLAPGPRQPHPGRPHHPRSP